MRSQSTNRVWGLAITAIVLLSCAGAIYLWSQGKSEHTAEGPARGNTEAALPDSHAEEIATDSKQPARPNSRSPNGARETVAPEQNPVALTVTAGTVVDGATRQPIVGARVLSADTAEQLAVSGESGNFLVECGDAPLRLVEISHPDYITTQYSCTSGRDIIVPLSRGVQVHGVVRQAFASGETSALADHELRARVIRPRRGLSIVCRTGIDGSYAFMAPPESRLRLEVILPEMPPWVEPLELPAHAIEHDVVVRATSVEAKVQVSDQATGLPVSESQVTCGGTLVGTTDESGRLSVRLFPDQYSEVRARRLGYVDRSDRVRVSPDQEPPPIQLQLVPEARLKGLVVNSEQEPLDGAHVELEIARTGLGRKALMGVEGLGSGASTTTDVEGKFSFAGLGSNYGKTRARVVVRHRGYATFESEFVDIANGSQDVSLKCQLSAGMTLQGRVTVNGLPARATVVVEGSRASAQTNRLGWYVIEGVDRGVQFAQAYLDPLPEIRKRVALRAPAAGGLDLDIALDYTMEVIHGTVSTPQGEPVSGVGVFCELELPGRARPQRYSTVTDSSGFYALSIPTPSQAAPATCKVLLRRWMDDVEIKGITPPAVVDLEARGVGTVIFSTIMDVEAQSAAYVEVLWESSEAGADPSGEEEEALVCEDRQALSHARTRVVVPAGEGSLILTSHGFRDRRVELSLLLGEVIDLGSVEMLQLASGE